MKTTLNLEDGLIRAAKIRAAERRVTLTQVVEEALRAALEAPAQRRPFKLRLRTTKGRKPPAVDIADRDALYEVMEGRR